MRINEIVDSVRIENLIKIKQEEREDIDDIKVMRDLAQSTDLIDNKLRKKS